MVFWTAMLIVYHNSTDFTEMTSCRELGKFGATLFEAQNFAEKWYNQKKMHI